MISKVVSRVYLDTLSFTFIKGELEAKTRSTKNNIIYPLREDLINH